MTTPSPAPVLSRRNQIVQDYENRTNVLLSTLALVYLLLFTLQAIYYYPDERWYVWANAFGNVLWILFALDLSFRFFMSSPKKGFFRHNWLDTITVVIPQLRALRALRAFSSKGVLAREGKGVFSRGALATGLVGAGIIVWVGALMVLSAERGAPGSDIESLSEAVWWCFETITTVGYGDFVPVTPTGRTVAVAIMLVGISVLGVVTATLSASLVKQAPPTPPAGPELLGEIDQLKRMVASLEAKLDAALAPSSPPSASGT